MSGTPAGYFSAPQYTGTAEWKVTGGAAAGGLFAANTAYTATVSLTAVSGWTFTGVAAAFTHTGASDVKVQSNTGDSITVIIGFPATGFVPPAAVNDLDLTEKVPAPVRGGMPVGYFSAPEYTGTVAWTQTAGGVPVIGGLFAASTAYTAEVTLTAASGWTFTGVSGFTYKGAKQVTPGSNGGVTITVNIAFDATGLVPAVQVNDLDLASMVPRPVMSGAPSGWFSAPQYTGMAEWTVTDGAAAGGLFAANTKYTAVVMLTAASGWTFGNPPVSFTHKGASSISSVDNHNGTMTVTVKFPETGFVPPVPVTDLNLTEKVPAPARDGVPVRLFSAPEYTGTVVWKVTGKEGAVDGLFQAGTAYTGTVTLTAASGWTFGNPPVSFTHAASKNSDGTSKVISADNHDGTMTVTIPFPATLNVVSVPVTNLDLSDKVPVPARDGVPVGWVSTSEYTGTVVWKVKAGGAAVNGLFQANTQYTAEVTLMAASGRIFEGRVRYDSPGVSITESAEIPNPAITETITFGSTSSVPVVMVDDLELSDKVPAPARDGVPAGWFSANQYSGNVVWKSGTVAHSGLFAANMSYTAEVSLTAASGWTFTGLPPNPFTHSAEGSTESDFHNNNDGTATLTITFLPTGNVPVSPVTETDLTDIVSRPVRGGVPVRSFTAPGSQYTGTVTWTETDGPAVTGLFDVNTAYTGTVRLTAASGWTFGEKPYFFTHNGAVPSGVSAEPHDGGVTVTINFFNTALNTLIESVNLKDHISEPVNMGAPVTSFSPGTYSGTVVWTKTADGTPLIGLFQSGTEYTATATLIAAAGYTFTGAVTNTVFTYPGALDVSGSDNTGATVKVTVKFGKIGGAGSGLDAGTWF
jgi:hypothetical protein